MTLFYPFAFRKKIFFAVLAGLILFAFSMDKNDFNIFSIFWNSKIIYQNKIKNETEKFLSCVNMGCTGGLGNQMFQLASMFALGKAFNRTLFFSSNSLCNLTLITDIQKNFPHFAANFIFQNNQPEETFNSEFGLDCCKYHNPENFHDVKEKYLVLNENYLQSYKYFDGIKHEIRHMFEFNEKINVSVQTKITEIFKNANFHKLCIHIRRDDFIDHLQQESRAEFIEPAIPFLHQSLTQNGIKNISLIFLGQDPNFIKSLKYDESLYSFIHYPEIGSREEDLLFGMKVCDTLLITASGSTFAWWIGYLMSEGSQVFYNSQVSKTRNFSKDFYDFDYFPHEWNMLELNKIEGKVYLDNRWYYERFGWPKNAS